MQRNLLIVLRFEDVCSFKATGVNVSDVSRYQQVSQREYLWLSGDYQSPVLIVFTASLTSWWCLLKFSLQNEKTLGPSNITCIKNGQLRSDPEHHIWYPDHHQSPWLKSSEYYGCGLKANKKIIQRFFIWAQ